MNSLNGINILYGIIQFSSPLTNLDQFQAEKWWKSSQQRKMSTAFTWLRWASELTWKYSQISSLFGSISAFYIHALAVRSLSTKFIWDFDGNAAAHRPEIYTACARESKWLANMMNTRHEHFDKGPTMFYCLFIVAFILLFFHSDREWYNKAGGNGFRGCGGHFLCRGEQKLRLNQDVRDKR